MEKFLSRYRSLVTGTLSGFDRIVFRGILQPLMRQFGMYYMLKDAGMQLLEFKRFALATTEMVKNASLGEALREKRPILYLQSATVDKQALARRVLADHPIEEGLICVFKALEPCMTFQYQRSADREERGLRLVPGKCLHLYHYWLHPQFGFMNARIQTWFPFTIQICLNGREWLARQLLGKGQNFRRADNCFTWLDNPAVAQRLMDEQLTTAWPAALSSIARSLNPCHETIFRSSPMDYYWTAYQTEWATDLLFRDPQSLITTGNTKSGQPTEPSPNRGLSLLRLDPLTGAVAWQFQPVPWVLDADPDWSAPPTMILGSCGTVVISTMKDGWTHALNESGTRLWTYPPATIPFTPGDGTVHNDTRYMRGGAAWGDVYIAMNGGLNVTTNVSAGYKRLHAFNTCAAPADRVRWLIDVPGTSGSTYSLGPPTVTRGIVYVGTDQGHVVAIADPSLVPPAGYRCVNPDVSTANCVTMGYTLVPDPAVLANVTVTGSMVYTEPAIANGKLYVSTGGFGNVGYVYMLSP